MKQAWNIKKQMLLMMIIIAILLAGIEAVMLANAVSSSRKSLQQELEGTVALSAQNTRNFFEEIESNIDNLYSSPKLQEYFVESNPEDRFISSRYVHDIINATIYGNSNINSIMLIQNNYRISMAGSSLQRNIFHRANQEYGLFERIPDTPFYTRAYSDDTTGKPFIAYIRPVYPVNWNPSTETDSHKKLFYVLCELESLQKYLDSLVPSGSGITVSIESGEGIILSSDPALLGKKSAELPQASQHFLTASLSFPKTGWTIRASSRFEPSYRKILSLQKENLLIALISLAVITEIGIWITRNLTSPITKLSNDINALPSAEFLPDDYSLPEIQRTARYINSMLKRIQEANRGLLEAQKSLHEASIARKEAELAFFQMQINPHFLYNTLECMRSIGYAYQAPEIQILASSMAKIFRYSVKARDYVRVSEELTCTTDYFDIINVRFPGRYQLKIDIPMELRSVLMPKMILQPLIENAIAHGLEEKRQGGVVKISAHLENQDFCIQTADNGMGIRPEQLQKIRLRLQGKAADETGSNHRTGVALDNINRRIQLEFGSSYGLSIDSQWGTGTRVTIRIPYKN